MGDECARHTHVAKNEVHLLAVGAMRRVGRSDNRRDGGDHEGMESSATVIADMDERMLDLTEVSTLLHGFKL